MDCNCLGLIFSQGPLWQQQRRFTVRHLRDLGFGKTSIENQIIDEISELIQEMTDTASSNADGKVDFKGLFSVSVINILWAFGSSASAISAISANSTTP